MAEGRHAGAGEWGAPLVAWLAVAALVTQQWGWSPAPELGDHAQYVLHARALVEGRPYGDIGYLYHPATFGIGPPAYPPGFPLFLAPFVALFGTPPVLFRWLMLASVGWASWWFVRRTSVEQPRSLALVASAMAAFAMEWSGGLLVPLSDPGFCALAWLTVLVIDRGASSSWDRRWTLAVTTLGFATLAFRSAGVVLIPVLAVHALLTWRQHRGRALVPALVWGGAGATALLTGLVTFPYQGLLAMVLQPFGARWVQSFDALRFAMFEALTYPLPWNTANDIYHGVAGGLAVIGGSTWLWRSRSTCLAWFVIGYGLMILVLPIGNTRYYWPVYPAIALAFLDGIRWVLLRARVTPTPWAAGAGAVVLLGAAVSHRSATPPSSALWSPAGREMFSWIEAAATREPMRVAFHNPRLLTLETGTPAMGLAYRTTAGQLAAFDDRHITHLVTSPGEGGCLAAIVARLPVLHPERMREDWTNGAFHVYRLLPGPAVPDDAWEVIDWEHPERYCPGLSLR